MSKRIKIYGERNTNTNYLERLIRLNLDVRQIPGVVPGHLRTIQAMVPGKEWLKNLYFARFNRSSLGWKHTRVMSPSEFETLGAKARDICFISITKNPYSWLLSLFRKPYSRQYQRGTPAFETFLQTPWKTLARDNCEELLENPIVLWNIKNASYLPLVDLNGLNITTESTVQDPEAIVDLISKHFSIEKRGKKFLNYEKSTKDTSKNFAYYQDYYLNERWRDDVSDEAISIINKVIDKSLMKRFGYQVIGSTG